jgi:hypothetical protein
VIKTYALSLSRERENNIQALSTRRVVGWGGKSMMRLVFLIILQLQVVWCLLRNNGIHPYNHSELTDKARTYYLIGLQIAHLTNFHALNLTVQ